MNEELNKSYIVGKNMTNFFNRELFMYSLGDIKFKKPIALRRVVYTLLFMIVWSLPLFLIFGFQLNPFFLVVALAPPIFLGFNASRPIFGGKNFFDFVKSMVNHFFNEPKGWTDLKAAKNFANEVFFVENEIWISRRRELQILADLKDAEKRSKRRRK